MLNRNAEALFWVGRYMERAENHARLIDVHYHIQQEGDYERKEQKWERLIQALGAEYDYSRLYGTYSQKDVLTFITLSRDYSNSLFSCVSQARGNLRTLREKLPSEMWEVMNSFYLWLGAKQPDDLLAEGPHSFYKAVKERSGMFYGVQQSVMLREDEWYFMESGKYLERAENTVRILHSVIQAILEDQAPPYLYLLTVLKSVSGYQAFRKYYADAVSVEHLMEFLIGSPQFPRSIQFAFTRLEECLARIEFALSDSPLPKERSIRLASRVKAELDCLEKGQMTLPYVRPLLDEMVLACQKLGKTIECSFFTLEGATA
ncbi:alpha-E domain-containing protein [Paenibacillus koleovorans]|uniref:alpha-E domain-containing protein n=1 Tax=Paenibacillus koleovorans TaxID=121608 RepID=UPI000FDAEE1A|nr:alpha-E domain-containing protein [Paenibacillus koleovorans]